MWKKQKKEKNKIKGHYQVKVNTGLFSQNEERERNEELAKGGKLWIIPSDALFWEGSINMS